MKDNIKIKKKYKVHLLYPLISTETIIKLYNWLLFIRNQTFLNIEKKLGEEMPMPNYGPRRLFIANYFHSFYITPKYSV